MNDINILKSILKNEHLSQKDVALLFGVSKQFISSLLKPNTNKKISKKIYLKMQELFPSYFSELKTLTIPDKIDYKYLEHFRKHYRYSKIEIAKYLGISQPYYSLLASNKKQITNNIITRLKILNTHPNKVVSIPTSKKQTVNISYYASLADYQSKVSRKLSIDSFIFFNAKYSESNIACFKFDFNNVSCNIFVDTSQPIKNNEKYLFIKDNKLVLCNVQVNKKKVKCISTFDKNTFYFDTNITLIGELMGMIKV